MAAYCDLGGSYSRLLQSVSTPDEQVTPSWQFLPPVGNVPSIVKHFEEFRNLNI